MKEQPLLMKGPLVKRSLLDIKTATRRLLTQVAGIGVVTEFQRSSTLGYDFIMRDRRMNWNDLRVSDLLERCPYGAQGDRLWVRETWRQNTFVDPKDGPVAGVLHKATYTGLPIPHARWGVVTDKVWRPAIFMPRDACRLVLEIKGVVVERLQDITEDGIRAEGVDTITLDELIEMGATRGSISAAMSVPNVTSDRRTQWGVVESYWRNCTLLQRWRVGWNSINGHRPGARWEENPWVWVIQYSKV